MKSRLMNITRPIDPKTLSSPPDRTEEGPSILATPAFWIGGAVSSMLWLLLIWSFA